MTSVEAYLEAKARSTDAALEDFLARCEGIPEGLEAAIRYCLFAGGKRLRPALVLGAAEVVCGDSEAAIPAACAVEMIHTYSLVHDDLPCMDDDDIRRGKPTVHRKYDEATAVLVGDGLQSMAFEMLAETGNAEVMAEMARAAGAAGMAGGQYVDLQIEGRVVELEDIQSLHRMKTGALLRAAARVGAMLGGAKEAELAALTAYGENVGLAFQIADDVLDVIGDDDVMGKRSGMDKARRKSTYPGLVGLDEARRLGDEAAARAVEALGDFGDEADALRELARFVVERRR